ncbi:MAG: hypothetical protein KDJ28_11175 [Candidatus Competibacteraceae bacterium]|nr:hypothetical protein [Candidatus Competibacteraceae bacterium]
MIPLPEPWPLTAHTANLLGLPLSAVTPTAPLLAGGDGGLWFEPMEPIAIGHGFTGQQGFPAASLEDAWTQAQQQTVDNASDRRHAHL